MKTTTLRWGILATGGIAHSFARGLATSRTGKLVAIGSRDVQRAQQFAAEFRPQHGEIIAHGSYESLLADPNVDAVYIGVPHSLHAPWSIAAIRAGKAVLCEKPLAMNASEAEAIFREARERNVFVMEAFMYRCHPQTRQLVELVRAGLIGQVRQIDATFSFLTTAGVESRLINPKLGGGGILDVGCYAASMTRLIAGVAQGKSFAEPEQLKSLAVWEQGGAVDSYATAVAKFPGNILARLSCGMRLNQENAVRIYGTDGALLVREPWVPSPNGGVTEIVVHQGLWSKRSLTEKLTHKLGQLSQWKHRDEYWTEAISIESHRSIYAYEADVVAEALASGKVEAAEVSWDDTLGNMRLLDRWLVDAK